MDEYWEQYDINVEFTDTCVRKKGSKRRRDLIEWVANKFGTRSFLTEMNLQMKNLLDFTLPKKVARKNNRGVADDVHYRQLGLREYLEDCMMNTFIECKGQHFSLGMRRRRI